MMADPKSKEAAGPDEGEPAEAAAVDAEVVETDEEELDALAEGARFDEEPEVIDLDISKIGGRKRDALAVSSQQGLARRDPLAAYMRDVSRYPLLSREEEHALAVAYADNGDLDAARKLVTSNLRLVVKIAYDYRQAHKNLLDLVQEGNIGLMQAVKKYDPYKGVKLSTYAAWWIRAYILRSILNNYRLVKLGTTQAQRKLFFNLKKEKARLSAMGIEPTHEKIAESLDVPLKDVVSMDRRLAAGDASLDAPIGSAEGRVTTRGELLVGDDAPADETLANAEVKDVLTATIREYGKTLEGKEQVIFEERLMNDSPKTLQELGDHFGVSRERIRQIEKRLLRKMEKHLREKLGDAVVDVYEP